MNYDINNSLLLFFEIIGSDYLEAGYFQPPLFDQPEFIQPITLDFEEETALASTVLPSFCEKTLTDFKIDTSSHFLINLFNLIIIQFDKQVNILCYPFAILTNRFLLKLY